MRPRLPVYPEFFRGSGNLLPDALKTRVVALADEDGYVKGGMERYAGRN